MERIHDIIVVGAGPAGASCARRAAELGLSVLILEKAETPGTKPCAGGMTERALALLGGDEEPVVHRRLLVADVALGRDLVFTLTGDVPLVATTSRGELDALLVRSAESAGARTLLGRAVKGVSEEPGAVRVVSGSGEWLARGVVFADGARGVGRRLIRMPALRHAGAAYVRAFPDSPGAMGRFADRVSFDLTAARRGYGWVFPKIDHLNAGVFSQRPLSQRLLVELESFLASAGLSQWRAEGPFAFPIPILPAGETPGRGHCLLAGDAAGLVDPVSGEGIPMAIASGRAAAESVATSLESGREALSIYRRRVVSEIVPMAESMRRRGKLIYGLGPGLLRGVGRVAPLRAVASRVLRSAPSVRGGTLTVQVNACPGPFAPSGGGRAEHGEAAS
jgi:geranylgeranyl reductase family protein